MSRTMSSTTSVTPQQQQNALHVPKEKIAMRAYEKWCKRGKPHGTDKQDWIDAENELKTEMTRNSTGQGQSRR